MPDRPKRNVRGHNQWTKPFNTIAAIVTRSLVDMHGDDLHYAGHYPHPHPSSAAYMR